MIVDLYIVTKEYKKQLVDYCNLLALFFLSPFPFITVQRLLVYPFKIHIYHYYQKTKETNRYTKQHFL